MLRLVAAEISPKTCMTLRIPCIMRGIVPYDLGCTITTYCSHAYTQQECCLDSRGVFLASPSDRKGNG